MPVLTDTQTRLTLRHGQDHDNTPIATPRTQLHGRGANPSQELISKSVAIAALFVCTQNNLSMQRRDRAEVADRRENAGLRITIVYDIYIGVSCTHCRAAHTNIFIYIYIYI